MQVVLTHAQMLALRRRLPKLYVERMVEHRKPHFGKQHRYELPIVAWRKIERMLAQSIYGPAGGKTNASKALYSAVEKILAVLEPACLHPAFQNRGVVGRSELVFPAWERKGGIYSPVPMDSAGIHAVYDRLVAERGLSGFTLLKPTWSDVGGHLVTTWRASDAWPWANWLFDEASHLEFL